MNTDKNMALYEKMAAEQDIPGTCGAGDFCFSQPFLNRIQIFLQNKLQPIFCVLGLLLAQLRA